MKDLSQIAENIKNIAKTDVCTLHVAEVTAAESDTCTIKIGETEIEGVRLTSVVNDSETKLIITPAIGSCVAVADVSNGRMTDFLVLQYSEIDSLQFTIGNTKLTINTEGVNIDAEGVNINSDAITFNGGDNGGLAIVEKIQSNFDKIKNYLTQLNTAIANGMTAIGASTAASGPTGASTFNSATASMQLTFDDMENTTITH